MRLVPRLIIALKGVVHRDSQTCLQETMRDGKAGSFEHTVSALVDVRQIETLECRVVDARLPVFGHVSGEARVHDIERVSEEERERHGTKRCAAHSEVVLPNAVFAAIIRHEVLLKLVVE